MPMALLSARSAARRGRERKRSWVLVLWLACMAAALSVVALTESRGTQGEWSKLKEPGLISVVPSTHKLRRWHKLDSKNLDNAAVAMVLGWGLVAAGKRVALELQMRQILTDEKLRKLYNKALEDLRDTREQYKRELDARDRKFVELKEHSSNKITEYRNRVEKLNEEHKEEVNNLKVQIEALKKRIKELEEEILRLKAQITKLEAQLQKADKQITDYKGKIEAYDERAKHMEHLIHEKKEKYMALKAEKHRLESLEVELENARHNTKSLQEELVKTKTEAIEAAAAAAKKERALSVSSEGSRLFSKLRLKELGIGAGIFGAGSVATVAGVSLGQRFLSGRFKPNETNTAEEPGTSRLPPPPEAPSSYDNAFMDKQDRIFDVRPCPCTDNPDEWDWHWWLILTLAMLLFMDIIYRVYNWLAERNSQWLISHEGRLSSIRDDVRRQLETSASDLQLLRGTQSEDPDEMELKVKENVLEHLREVDQTLLEAQSALSQYKCLEYGERERQRESKQTKEQRLELRDALEDCLRASEVGTGEDGDNKHVDPTPPGGANEESKETKERGVNAHKFISTLLEVKFRSSEIQNVVNKLKAEFTDAENMGALDKTATVKWEGNEFDEISFYRTNLTHVETREGRERTESTPIVDSAHRLPVHTVASAFDAHVRTNTQSNTQKAVPGTLRSGYDMGTLQSMGSITPRIKYSPAKRLRTLFDEYMRAMQKKTTSPIIRE